MPPRHVFVQIAIGPARVQERAAIDRRPPVTCELDRDWARAPRGIAGAVKHVIGRALRIVGFVLFASPLLGLGRFVLRWKAPLVADWLAVIFVLLVCLFFALLNLFILASVAAWIVRNRMREPYLVRQRGRVHRRIIGNEATERSAPGERVIAEGIATRLDPAGDGPLLSDTWDRTERRTEADDFALRRDGDAIPVVVRFETAPDMLGGSEVREGDRVTIVGTVREIAESTDRIELGDERRALPRAQGADDAPYRTAPAGPAIVIGDADDPVTVIAVPRG